MTTHCADATALDTTGLNASSNTSSYAQGVRGKAPQRQQRSALNVGLLIGSAGLCALAVVAWLLMVF